MSSIISNIVEFRARIILKWFKRFQCIINKPPFGAHFDQVAWLCFWTPTSWYGPQLYVFFFLRQLDLRYTREIINLLHKTVSSFIICRHININKPGRFCDMPPCDLFARGCLKPKLYVNNPYTILVPKIYVYLLGKWKGKQ